MKYPRCYIELTPREGGNAVAVNWQDVISLTVTDTMFSGADSFELTLNNSRLLSDYIRKEMDVKIYLGYVKNQKAWTKTELTHIFTGKIDGIRPSFGARDVVGLIGRDYAALFLDNEFNLQFAERTASQIAQLLAERHGLTAVVTPTTVIVEKDMYKDKTEWQILQTLADREGYTCYVTKDKELYFGIRQEPEKDEDGNEKAACTFFYKKEQSSNILSVTFDDSMLEIINKVTVRHFFGRKKQLVQASATNDDLIKKYGVKERIVYDSKALTTELVQRTAEALLGKLDNAVVTFSGLETEGIATIGAENLVNIEGCGRFDGSYYLTEVRHSFSMNGYGISLSGTNQQPDAAAQYRENLYEREGIGNG